MHGRRLRLERPRGTSHLCRNAGKSQGVTHCRESPYRYQVGLVVVIGPFSLVGLIEMVFFMLCSLSVNSGKSRSPFQV